MNDQNIFMTRCLGLAKNGLGHVYPNPMVGAVIVHNGLIIGEGWHRKAGEPHAEVVAIESVKNKELLPGSTLYVNLEPCSHHGKTPPCADLIISSGIKKVVISSVDTNKQVSGRGIKRLENHGVKVVTAVLEKQGRDLNKRFFTYHEKKRPYVVLKWAQSKDGFIFPDPAAAREGIPYWISNRYSLQRVHQWRAEEAAILVGKKTVQQDNPQLNVRHFSGHSILRIAIDRKLELDASLHFFDGSSDTIIYNELLQEKRENLQFVQLDFSRDLVPQIMINLYEAEVQSLIVEGGAHTLNSFIQSQIWDEARVFYGAARFGSGLKAPQMEVDPVSEQEIEDNLLKIFKNDIHGK